LTRQKRRTDGSPPGRLRIVAGKWRNRLLPVPDEAGLRPTAERIRETLFNWLTPVIEGARCLDLFAGTGALGLEALSRGAASTVFVEKSARVAEQLRASIATLVADNASVHIADGFSWLTESPSQPFDVVFLDPPFTAARYEELCRLLEQRHWLARNACVYLEQDRRQVVPPLPAGWRLVKEKTAGNVRYSLIRVEH